MYAGLKDGNLVNGLLVSSEGLVVHCEPVLDVPVVITLSLRVCPLNPRTVNNAEFPPLVVVLFNAIPFKEPEVIAS